MADNNITAPSPAATGTKKPRAKKAAPNGGPAEKALTAKRTASSKSATPGTRRKAVAKVPEVAEAATAAVAGAVTGAVATVTNGKSPSTVIDTAKEKVSAMIPDNMAGKAKDVAVDVKDKASDAVHSLARIISDSAGAIDDNVGPKYGDYARSAAQSVSDAADRLRAKPVDEIAHDTREFVRTKPGAALGIAAVASLILAKIFGSVFGKKR